jgi:hypothetical protein
MIATHLELGTDRIARVPLYDAWEFLQKTYACYWHAKYLQNWRSRRAGANIFQDVQDGTVFSFWDSKLQDHDIRLIVYWDGVCTAKWGRRVSTGVLRALPANYPRWMRSFSELWWTLALVDEAAVRSSTVDMMLEKFLDRINCHVQKGDRMFEAHGSTLISPRIQVCGTLGDLPARNVLFHFNQGMCIC